jgi:hypothetical protein
MKRRLSLLFLLLTGSVIHFFLTGCAYKLGTKTGSLPGEVKSIEIPLFENASTEPGIETYFTNALKNETLKSRVVKLVNKESEAEGVLQGKIVSVDVLASESVIESTDAKYLPKDNVMNTSYTITVSADLVLKKKGSSVVLWSGNFKQALNYSAPQITLPVINTANNLYNQSAKRQTLDAISKEMMQAAFDRMLENF